MTQIILVRHGQTEWNRVERFRGRIDIPLNETGLSQADATAARIARNWQPAAIYTSPLVRARVTAETIGRHCNLTVHIDPRLTDIDYGKWQGLTPEEAREQWDAVVDIWYHAPEQVAIPGGESLANVRLRAVAAMREFVGNHPADTIVLVSHTVVNRLILLDILGLGNERFWRLKQDTCAINILETNGDDFTLVNMNDTCHLR